MTHRAVRLAFATLLVVALGGSPAAAQTTEPGVPSDPPIGAAEDPTPSTETSNTGTAATSGDLEASGTGDVDIPGVPLPRSPFSSDLNSHLISSRVYSVWLNQGDTLSAWLTIGGASVGFRPALYLYPPGSPSLRTQPNWIASSPQAAFPKTLSYTAASSGYHYLDVFQPGFTAAPETGNITVAWSVSGPVYRFYNARNETHFFTPSLDERNMVIALWSSVFNYEGIAYFTQPYVNSQPLYRFYNRRSASHFYTASLDEANSVIIQWSNVFTYEGQTYKVSLTGPASATVYRFYNRRNGSHFFTASAQERDTVIARWSNVYTYEGPAFHLNP